MSLDDPTADPADVPVETAQDAVEPTEPTPEFTGEYDPARARRTIDHLREREKELEQQAKQYDRLRNDPDAFREFVSDMGYELPEDEPDEDVETPQPTFQDPRVDQLLAEREQERHNKAVLDQGMEDVQAIQKELGRELREDELAVLTKSALPDENGMPRVLLAYESFKAYNELQKPEATPARPPVAGEQGSKKFDIQNPDERQAHIAAILTRDSGG